MSENTISDFQEISLKSSQLSEQRVQLTRVNG